MKLYANLRAGYQGWIGSIRTVIESGDLKKFKKDQDFKKKCEDVSQAGKVFAGYVESLSTTEAAGSKLAGFKITRNWKTKMANASDLLDLTKKAIQIVKEGIELIKGPDKEKQRLELRHQLAEYFGAGTDWLRWDEIATAMKDKPDNSSVGVGASFPISHSIK